MLLGVSCERDRHQDASHSLPVEVRFTPVYCLQCSCWGQCQPNVRGVHRAGAGMMYSEFVPRRPQQAMMSPSATALPAIRSSVAQPSASLGAATSSTASQTMPKEQSNSVVLSDEESDKVQQGCSCWPFGR